MMQTSEIYTELEVQAARLSEESQKLLSLEEILSDYILPELPTKEQIELGRILAEKKDPKTVQILEDIRAIRKAIKILALMEASDNVEEFHNLAEKQKKSPKKKEKPYELTDFDKLIVGIASVPKPTKEQMKEYLKNRPKDISEEVRTTLKKSKKK